MAFRLRRAIEPAPDPLNVSLRQLRKGLSPISLNKYNDLISLCIDGIIPTSCHAFYVLLPNETKM